MGRYQLRERFAYNFQTALENAGMQDSDGTDVSKPKYWRGQVDDTTADLFVLFSVDNSEDLESADNKLFRQVIYIDGQVFTRSGYGDGTFQDLVNAIETQCNLLNISIDFTGEGRDNSIDTESPIYYITFEARQRLMNI